MLIRKAKENEIDKIMNVYAAARDYMKKSGNITQWGNHYPPRDLIVEDIKVGQLYVGICEDGELHCAFAFLKGIDPTYLKIDDGKWLNDEAYMTIHRIASDGKYHGVFKKCMDYCKQKYDNLRIDTHENNLTMQHVLSKNEFIRCGVIYLENGAPRIAYQYSKT